MHVDANTPQKATGRSKKTFRKSVLRLPGDYLEIDQSAQNDFGLVMSKINHYLKTQFTLQDSPLNLNATQAELKRKKMKEIDLQKDIQMNLKGQVSSPVSSDAENSVDSAKRRESIKKKLADQLVRSPITKLYDSKIFETDLKYFREWFRVHEKLNQDKYDFFYGPMEKEEIKRREVNQKRLHRIRN